MVERQLRTELADVSFEDLQQIEEKVGSKLYNEALFGPKESQHRPERGSNVRRDGRRGALQESRRGGPLETSSKRPFQKPKNVMQAKKKVFRDPRFDDLSGTFNEETFEQDYSFVKDIQDGERQAVKSALRNCEDEEETERLKKLLYRMNQQDIARKRKEARRRLDGRLKMQEQEMVKQGKKPYFFKKSDKKILELAEQYKDLKKSGKLEKYLAKKRKKNIAKDRGDMPSGS